MNGVHNTTGMVGNSHRTVLLLVKNPIYYKLLIGWQTDGLHFGQMAAQLHDQNATPGIKTNDDA